MDGFDKYLVIYEDIGLQLVFTFKIEKSFFFLNGFFYILHVLKVVLIHQIKTKFKIIKSKE